MKSHGEPVACRHAASLFSGLVEFAHQPRFSDDLADALGYYAGGEPAPPPMDPMFNVWYVHDYHLRSSGLTMLETYVSDMMTIMDPSDVALLSSWEESRYGIYKVIDVQRGTGFVARDIFDDTKRTVYDARLSRSISRNGIFLGMLHDVEDHAIVAGSVIMSIPKKGMDSVMDMLQRQCGELGCNSPVEVLARSSLDTIWTVEQINNPMEVVPIKAEKSFEYTARYNVNAPIHSVMDALSSHGRFLYSGTDGGTEHFMLFDEEHKPDLSTPAGSMPEPVIDEDGEVEGLEAELWLGNGELRVGCTTDREVNTDKILSPVKEVVERVLGSMITHDQDEFEVFEGDEEYDVTGAGGTFRVKRS